MIGFIGAAITITLNYSHLSQLTIGDCLRLVPSQVWFFLVWVWVWVWVWVLYYDRRSVGQSVLDKAPMWGSRPNFYYCLTATGLFWCGALSLTRGRVCPLQLLLGLASAVIFGCESRGTRDRILLSQIRGFPFRRHDSQGYGGGIRPRLHTGDVLSLLANCCPFYSLERTEYKPPCRTINSPLLFCLLSPECLW
jgi:hypothetical protein